MIQQTQQELMDLFDYEDGNLIWKVSNTNSIKVGDIAGSTRPDGYVNVNIGNTTYLLHRLIWCYHTGDMPKYQVDHIDGDNTNNRIENLRDVTQTTNQKNAHKRIDNTSGQTGVTWHIQANKWASSITSENHVIHLGVFDDINDAIKARKDAEVTYGFSKRHGS